MPRSMTGYGRGESIVANRRFVVEIKSVNHRYSDITIKLPRALNSLEDRARKLTLSQISRGKTDIYIHMESLSCDDVSVKANLPLAKAYLEQLEFIKDALHLPSRPDLSMITRFPDILMVDKSVSDEESLSEMESGMSEALTSALSQFTEMREREGLTLTEDIRLKQSEILTLTEQIEERSPLVIVEYQAKLQAKVAKILENVTIDENRLLLEVTLFSEKSCIDEEITRLKSHLLQLTQILQEQDAVGRKLDFLVQEMNREANTIGSKSNDLEITRLTVLLKAEIEKIREQVQNLE